MGSSDSSRCARDLGLSDQVTVFLAGFNRPIPVMSLIFENLRVSG